MKKSLLICSLLAAFALCMNAQAPRFDVFVKNGCSNCAFAKKILADKGDQFAFHHVDSIGIGQQMVVKLRQIGYSGSIVMPVIIQNDSVLLHPAQLNNGRYSPVPLKSVLEAMVNYQNLDVTHPNSDSSDCEFSESSSVNYYIVCGSFDSNDQANHMVRVLVNRGYGGAGILFQNGMFRTYSHFFNTIEEAQEMLEEVRKNYRGAIILTEKH